MGRPRLWASDAERMAAKRKAAINEQPVAVPDPAVNERDAVEQTRNVNEHAAESEALEDETPVFVAFADCSGVPHDCKADPWIGAGRGTARTHKGRRFVLVARGTADLDAPEHGVVTEADWLARLAQTCEHGLKGWSCHEC